MKAMKHTGAVLGVAATYTRILTAVLADIAVDKVKKNSGKTLAIGLVTVASGGGAMYAAPLIRGAVSAAGLGVAGGTLSGAAATSAGLAFLGGGSLAAGGPGMAGGVVVCGAVGTVAGRRRGLMCPHVVCDASTPSKHRLERAVRNVNSREWKQATNGCCIGVHA